MNTCFNSIFANALGLVLKKNNENNFFLTNPGALAKYTVETKTAVAVGKTFNVLPTATAVYARMAGENVLQ